MARARNREAVLKTLRKALAEDRTKTFTAEISKLGLVEMTRQNVTEGVREIMSRPCPTCDGEGVIKSEETIAIELERQPARHRREVAQARRGVPGPDEPAGHRAVHRRPARVLHQLEAETGKLFFFEGSEGLPLDHFEVVMEGSADEIAERAVPFAAGDEVMVNDRRAAHVQRRRRRRQDRRLHHLGHRRRPARRLEGAGPDRRGRPHRARAPWPSASPRTPTAGAAASRRTTTKR